MSSVEVTLIVPGYSNPVPELNWSTGHQQRPWQIQLQQLLGRGDDPAQLAAARLFNPEIDASQFIVCADPIHLQADRDTASLVPGAMLGLSDYEADQLLLSCNEFLAVDGLEFFRHAPMSWYLKGMDASALASYPPSFLAHRNASAYLLEGEATASWRRLMTELQMLLHTHPVNQERQSRGRMPVNSVWFWGGAELPVSGVDAGAIDTGNEANPSHPVLYTDDQYANRLAAVLDIPCIALSGFQPGSTSDGLSDRPGNHIMVVDTRIAEALFANDELTANEVLARINEQWLPPLRQHLGSGSLSRVTLMNEDGAQGSLSAELSWLQRTLHKLVGKPSHG